ncbi:MAG: TAXI family TRAP transporter solute-binding subunit [Armatimonadota bacterium]|nr:TAXI family TRAP transporter solute-binding subunit [Armatimonadota bacterium]MDR7518035.1 TAXI family TRAP transporter solute-binding subunit [Armatimonadota bacterium]MDR7550498.1 TAXI family TRAP transporter solute-binding subunit [Armatimonadota bacterium]
MHRVWVVVCTGVLVTLAVLPAGAQREDWPRIVSIGTAPIGGVYYVWGGAFARIIQDVVGVPATVEATQGPIPNVRLVHVGQMTLGIATNGIVYDGFRGLDWAEGRKHDNVRVLLPMYSSHMHCVALARHRIASVRDLDGKPVGTGARGGTGDVYFRRVAEVLGIKPSRIVNVGFEDMNNLTRDGVIVGYCASAGLPLPSILELETTHDVRVFGVAAPDVRKVQEKWPYMLPGVVPPGTYKSTREPVPSVLGFNVLIGHKDLPRNFAYAIVKAAYDNQTALAAAHPAGKEMPAERAALSPAPLHAGAALYFQEKGVRIPPELLPPEYRR